MTNNTKNPMRRPLRIEEIPKDLRNTLDFSSQFTEFYQGRKSKLMTIKRTCPKCGSFKRVKVMQIRDSLRKGTFRGLCTDCFRKMSRPQPKGEKSHKWKGGRRETPKGYIMILRPNHPQAQNGYVQEHRLVMEKHLERFLLPFETVHHKNGIKSDNRLDNLELWFKSHSNGCRFEDLNIQQIEQLIIFLQNLLTKKQI